MSSIRPSGIRQALVLLAILAVCLATGAIGSAVTSTSVTTWYQQLHKPSFNPPDWIFAPVWTVLYIAMAVSAWNVWRLHGLQDARMAMSLFAIQMTLNLAWSIIFFGMRQIGLALVEIMLLFAAIVATTLAFWRLDGVAALLFVPYVAWVGFATLLNFAIWRLN